MKTVSEIMTEWRADAKVDDLNIDKESAAIPSLHAKYVQELSAARNQLKTMTIKRRTLVKFLRSYYLGLSTKEELEALKRTPWAQRIMKSEVYDYIEADEDLIAYDLKLAEVEERVDVLNEIMKSINGRNFNFKNIIDWRRFTMGG